MNKHEVLRARVRARRLAMQAVYQQQLTDVDLDELLEQFRQDESFAIADADYFTRLLEGGTQHRTEIAAKIGEIAGYEFALIDPVERAILLNAAYEILFVSEVDRKVAITEAVRLARKFGSEGSYRFVNGVLDKLDSAGDAKSDSL